MDYETTDLRTARIDNWHPFTMYGRVFIVGDVTGHPTHSHEGVRTGSIQELIGNVAFSKRTRWELGEGGDLTLLRSMLDNA